MSYVTQDECSSFLPIELLSLPDLPALLERASDQVDAMCFGRIQSRGMERLTQYQQEQIKKAVCKHAAFLHFYGDALESPLESYGINGVSMSFSPNRVITQGGTTTSCEVYSLLLKTGLAYRGVM